MNDDLRPEPHHNNPHAVQFFNTCVSCGMSHVLKPGDYCRACAGTWRLPINEDEYIVVTEDTVEEGVYQSELKDSYLRAKAAKCAKNNQHYVIFYAQDAWQEIVVHKQFYLPQVMYNIFQALGHK